jgi:5-hydroxyisourate hydrolase-like protein (transthyretin family)
LLLSLILPQQQRDKRPAPVGTGRIAGTVVDQESGRPIRFAAVLLTGADVVHQAVTDGAGTFSFDRLPAGAYRLRFSKPGYLDTAYGQARPGTDTPGKEIVLRDREPVARIVVPLSHGGVISGTIRDDRGDPVYGAVVSVSRWMTSRGTRQLEQVEEARTDERGNYRIALLPPRDYVLSAGTPDFSLPGPDGDPNPFDYATVFHPGVPSPTGAESIRLGLGEMRTNVDLTLPLVAIGNVSGVVLDASGKPAANVEVTLVSSREVTTGAVGNSTNTAKDGRFTFEKVAPGAYMIMATTITQGVRLSFDSSHFRLTHSSSSTTFVTYSERAGKELVVPADTDPPATPQPPAFAWGVVSVTGGGASNVTLTLEPPRKVVGRFVFEGTARPPATKELAIQLSALRGMHGTASTSIAEDGTFEIADVIPGRYAIEVNGFDAPWSLASVVTGGIDALDAFLDVPRDRDVRDLTITLRDRETELRGTVNDGGGRPASERTVVVFAADERLWAGYQRVQAEFIPANGTFSFVDLRPGRYLLAVVDGVEEREWLDAAFLRNLIPAAVPVALGEGERKVQDLRVR